MIYRESKKEFDKRIVIVHYTHHAERLRCQRITLQGWTGLVIPKGQGQKPNESRKPCRQAYAGISSNSCQTGDNIMTTQARKTEKAKMQRIADRPLPWAFRLAAMCAAGTDKGSLSCFFNR